MLDKKARRFLKSSGSAKHLNDWFEEFRPYHRKDGKVVKEMDDLMSATRYAVMMLRYGRSVQAADNFRRPIEYPRLSVV